MSLCRKLLCDMSSLHRIRTQRHRLLVLFLRLNIRDNAFFVHAVRNVNNIVHGGICRCLGIELDIIEAIQQCQIPGCKLEFVGCNFISLSGILIHKMHGQRMYNHTVVNLNHKL